MSSADLEAKYRKTTNPKKRRAIARVLFNRWWHTVRRAGDDAVTPGSLRNFHFGMEIR